MTTRSALVKARRGAAFLDAKLGRGWRRKIRRRDLNMAVGISREKGECGCILAQLYTYYDDGAIEMEIDADFEAQEDLGFVQSDDASYDQLTEAWLEVLREKA